MKLLATLFFIALFSFNIFPQYQIKSPYLQNPSLAIGYVDSCANFWLKAYDSTYSGFYTNIDKNGTQYSSGGTQKNLQTQSRDAYGFTRAFMLTGNDLYLYKARQALAFQYSHCWDNTNSGWYWETDKLGNPTSNNTTKDAFHQHYALLGPTAFFEATRDSSHWSWAIKGYNNNESKLWDARPQYLGYYNSAAANWSNKSGKSFNSTADAITTHLLHFYLLTGKDVYLQKLLAIADNLQTHLVQSMATQAIGFAEGYDANWVISPTDTMTIMGHILKTSWCLSRAYQFNPDTNFLFNAKKLFNHVVAKGYDTKLGGPYKDFSRVSGKMLMWGLADTAKAWWQMEQAVTAGLFLYKITGDQSYLKTADETLDFFMKYFVDHTYGEVYENRTRYGGLAWNEQKGNGNKAGYHSIELGYYTYLYGKFFVTKEPASLYYNFPTNTLERNLTLAPIEIPLSDYHIKDISRNGIAYYDFNSTQKSIHIAANDGGKFKVTFELNSTTRIGETAANIPSGYNLLQNYPNPFNPATSINFALPVESKTEIKVFDILGHLIATPVNRILPAGNHTIVFDGSNVPSGIYFYTLRAGTYTMTRKMVLIK